MGLVHHDIVSRHDLGVRCELCDSGFKKKEKVRNIKTERDDG